MDYFALGKRIREYRTSANMTQESFAEKLNLSTHYISQIETGTRKPSLETVFKISQVLNISMDDLFKDSTESKDNNKLYALITMLITRSDNEIEYITATVREMLKHIKNGLIIVNK